MQERRNNSLLLSIFTISILLMILIVILLFINKKTSILPKAYISNDTDVLSISFSNSYIFASPVKALAGGDFIRVTVFVLDEKGLGLKNKKVALVTKDDLLINNIQFLTDDYGKAFFDVGSNQKGTFSVGAEVSGVILNQKISLTFY